MPYGRTRERLPKPPMPPNPVYISYMINQSTSTVSRPHYVLKATFDMSTEGCDSFWEAHALIVKESGVAPEDILNVEYKGDGPNGWPMLEVTFDRTESAKVYTATYLGLDVSGWDVLTDDEVNDYLATAEYVRA